MALSALLSWLPFPPAPDNSDYDSFLQSLSSNTELGCVVYSSPLHENFQSHASVLRAIQTHQSCPPILSMPATHPSATQYDLTEYPTIVFLCVSPPSAQVRIISRLSTDITVDSFLTHLNQIVLPKITPYLSSLRDQRRRAKEQRDSEQRWEDLVKRDEKVILASRRAADLARWKSYQSYLFSKASSSTSPMPSYSEDFKPTALAPSTEQVKLNFRVPSPPFPLPKLSHSFPANTTIETVQIFLSCHTIQAAKEPPPPNFTPTSEEIGVQVFTSYPRSLIERRTIVEGLAKDVLFVELDTVLDKLE